MTQDIDKRNIANIESEPGSADESVCESAPEIEVTREMVEAGREAYFRNTRFDGNADSDVMVYAIFRDMCRASEQLKRFEVVEE